MSKRSVNHLVLMALLLSGGIILQAIEALYLPPLIIPGAKIGLANSITLLMIVFFGWRDVMTHVVLRVTTVALLTGTFLSTTFIYSLSGGLISAAVMLIWHRFAYGYLSYAGISLTGAISHNLTQLALAVVILGHTGVLFFLPGLMLMALVAGVPNGLLVNSLAPRLRLALGPNFPPLISGRRGPGSQRLRASGSPQG
jgi:heptaprenyl diphosphate synthase